MFIPNTALCTVGTCVITHGKHNITTTNPMRQVRQLIFTCVGDVGGGSIPDTAISESDLEFIRGWCLMIVEAYPTPGTITPPDAANIFILDSNGMDLLGSEDGGTTPYAGEDMIDATYKRLCFPNVYLAYSGLHTNYHKPIIGLLTLSVAGQGTNSAEYMVVLTFSK